MDVFDEFIEETKGHLDIGNMALVAWAIMKHQETSNDFFLDYAARICVAKGCPFPSQMQLMMGLAADHRYRTGKPRGTRGVVERHLEWWAELLEMEKGRAQFDSYVDVSDSPQHRKKITPKQRKVLKEVFSGKGKYEDFKEALVCVIYTAP